MDTETDLQLVQRYREGHRSAFAELMRRYQQPVYNAAFWVLRNAEDANDISQEVFLKVAERIDDYDPRFKFFSWIYRIAVNESLNLLRRNKKEHGLPEEFERIPADGADPEQQLGNAQLSQRVRSALMRMTTNDRTVLSLRHFAECSYEEIAQILDLDAKTVKSRLFEARQRLCGVLEDLK